MEENKKAEISKVGLALGGGAVFGAAHIGIIKALHEHKIQPEFLSGTSAGAFIAALLAFGKNWQEIEGIATHLSWFDVSGITFSKMGLLSNQKIGNLIVEHLGDVDISESKIPLAITTADISTGDEIVLRSGNLAKAIMASTCVPGVFIPVEIDGKLLVDGGIVDNVPVTSLREMGAGFKIGVDLITRQKNERPVHLIDLLVNSFHITTTIATRLQTSIADMLIQPDLSAYSKIKTAHVKPLIKEGYEEAKKALQSLGV